MRDDERDGVRTKPMRRDTRRPDTQADLAPGKSRCVCTAYYASVRNRIENCGEGKYLLGQDTEHGEVADVDSVDVVVVRDGERGTRRVALVVSVQVRRADASRRCRRVFRVVDVCRPVRRVHLAVRPNCRLAAIVRQSRKGAIRSDFNGEVAV